MDKIVGFQRIGSGDWYILDDGTKISSGEGDRILRFIRTVDNNKRSIHLSEAIGYVKSYAKLRFTQSLYNLAQKINRQ